MSEPTNADNPKPRMSIVGAGRVGQSIGKLMHDANVCDIGQIFNRRASAASQAVAFVGAGKPIHDLRTLDLVPGRGTDVLLITVPDDAIETCAQQLADLHPDLSGVTALHCSGSLSSEALSALQNVGAETASVHPVKSFSDPATSVDSFPGTYCAVETGQATSRTLVKDLFTRIGGETFDIEGRDKTLYHTAIVLVCNYLYALLHMGLETLQAAGIPEEIGKAAIEPIVLETVRNGFRLGPGKALTGPIVRGDTNTVAMHLSQLTEQLPQFGDAYRVLGQITAQLARSNGSLNAEQSSAILGTLNESD